MAKFIMIGYADREGYERTDPSIRDAAHAHDAALRKKEFPMGVAGSPMQVRNHNASRVEVSEGPYMASTLPIAGFALIEAPTMTEAVKLVSQTPCAVCYGVVEVWPLE